MKTIKANEIRSYLEAGCKVRASHWDSNVWVYLYSGGVVNTNGEIWGSVSVEKLLSGHWKNETWYLLEEVSESTPEQEEKKEYVYKRESLLRYKEKERI